MTYEQQSKLLAGPMALLKVYLTRIGGEIAADSVQIWGGRGITKGGMGVYIEQFQRAYKFDSIVCPSLIRDLCSSCSLLARRIRGGHGGSWCATGDAYDAQVGALRTFLRAMEMLE